MIDKTAELCRKQKIIIPTIAQMKDPATIPASIQNRLADVGLWDVDPANLFRVTWKNEPVSHGGGFNHGNWIEFPSSLTGVPARIIGLCGKYFPTGSHKVGAAFGCLVPRLVSGEVDSTTQKFVWPSTGNFCRGGAYVSALLDCKAVAILPEGMSSERFDWLRSIGAEIIATPGSESNVKEIYDKCWEIRRSKPDHVILNQFEELGNAVWHYHVTGSMIEELCEQVGGGRRERLPPATTFERSGPTSRSPLLKRCSVRRSSGAASASTVSKASATSTSRGFTTSGIPMSWSQSTTRTV